MQLAGAPEHPEQTASRLQVSFIQHFPVWFLLAEGPLLVLFGLCILLDSIFGHGVLFLPVKLKQEGILVLKGLNTVWSFE